MTGTTNDQATRPETDDDEVGGFRTVFFFLLHRAAVTFWTVYRGNEPPVP